MAQTEPDDELRRKRAIDYLEKIFQIPFWLERLNTGGRGDRGGGSYGAYVRELLKENERAEPGLSVFKSLVPPAKTVRGDTLSVEPDIEAKLDPSGHETSGIAVGGEPEDEFAAVDAALASLKLEQEEIAFLASPEIGAVASKSPRSVKRLINIYRIVRARLSDGEIADFLGKSGRTPRYPIAALLAAIETGQPTELADALYPALAILPEKTRMSLVWATPGRQRSEIPTEAAAAFAGIMTEFPVLGAAIAEVDRLCGERGATVEAYQEMARLVRRYSFNRYG